MSKEHSNAIHERADYVLSRDGTRISYLCMGRGPAVVLIPGALSMASDYTGFAQGLAEHFTVYVLERRGRGQSGPQGAEYSMCKECEDVLALQQKSGATILIGHSFGGLVALEAARGNPALTKVALYEPGVSIDGSISMDWMLGYEQKLAQKKYFDAFVEFSLASGPDRARNTPPWLMKLLMPLFISAHERKQMLGLLHENLSEHQEVAKLDSTYENYREIAAQVLLMYGGKGRTKWVELAIEKLALVLPHSETQKFPSLDHFGIHKKGAREVSRAVSLYLQT